MNLTVLAKKYSIYKFVNDSALPAWIYLSDFYSITKTVEEVSVVAIQNESISENITCSKDWRILKVAGPLDFSLVGIIADLSSILKDKRISIFTISTYDTDYILVKQKDIVAGIKALTDRGYKIEIEKEEL
jgi:uncharacterized protein